MFQKSLQTFANDKAHDGLFVDQEARLSHDALSTDLLSENSAAR
jgi:hypothetical protein